MYANHKMQRNTSKYKYKIHFYVCYTRSIPETLFIIKLHPFIPIKKIVIIFFGKFSDTSIQKRNILVRGNFIKHYKIVVLLYFHINI